MVETGGKDGNQGKAGRETLHSSSIQAAEMVLPCRDLDDTVAFFTDRLGFRLDAIFPADRPAVAVVSGHGLRLRLDGNSQGDPGRIRLLCRNPAAVAAGALELTAPNGTRIELAEAFPRVVLPPLQPSFVLSRLDERTRWQTGRAGMRYRDLIPGRQGGRFIASHIQIPGAGPVPDYVHYHRVHFQMIYCARGWVRVAYEDQGPSIILRRGDCVLQPPEIRHRVLEASAGLEVIEIGCPANHETLADHNLSLPTSERRPEREFGGQRFHHHEAAEAAWQPYRFPGITARDTGLAAATGGIAGVQVLRLSKASATRPQSHDADLFFTFVLQGAALLDLGEQSGMRLRAGDSFVVPAGLPHKLTVQAEELEILQVTLPAAFNSSAVADVKTGTAGRESKPGGRGAGR
ncbi:MAG: cupin domain-containing protein [Acidobacteriota bacterium]